MASPLRFGIMGTGNIASQFAQGVAGASRSTVAAVGSRTEGSARAFADRFALEVAHDSYEKLLGDAGIDAVYISLPNSEHHQWTLRALEAGKHVLCEKPIAANARQARAMFEAARRHNRVLVEAYMYASHPQTRAVLGAIAGGRIGAVRTIRAGFCYATSRTDPGRNIRFDPKLAGGALMDIGCYCVDFAVRVAGASPEAAQGMGHIHDTGVDDYAAGVLGFPGQVVAGFQCGMTVQADNAAMVCGSEGWLEVPVPWKPPAEGARFVIHGQTPPRQDRGQGAQPGPPEPEVIQTDAPAPLYGLEADAFAATVRDNAPPAVTADQSLAVMDTLDALRAQLGLTY